MTDLYILHGHTPVSEPDVQAWGQWYETADDERTIATTNVGDVRVSTIFLGLDHNFGGGPPILFETMIFEGEHDQWQNRYHTWDEAEAGHTATVAWLKGEGPEPE